MILLLLSIDIAMILIIIILALINLMKSLSRYDEKEDPVVLRKDFAKDHAGVGYYGSKMKSP